MKKIFLLFLLVNFPYCNAQSKGINANKDSYLAVLDSISNGITDPGYTIYINDNKITEEDKEWLDKANVKDFTSVKPLNKKDAVVKFGKDGEKGSVVLSPFIDDLLDVKYYTGITNSFVLNKMIPLLAKGRIQNNPLFVVDGKPLRGKEIENIINSLVEEKIHSIYHLKKDGAFKIYGIRALPGTLMILTKEYHKIHPETDNLIKNASY